MPKINAHIAAYSPKDYSSRLPEDSIELDCTLGVNPEPLPEPVLALVRERGADYVEAVKRYPHGEALAGKLAAWYNGRGIAGLKKEHFVLGDGSIDLLFNMNLLCLSPGKKALGHGPQFTVYVDHVNCIGAEYRFYPFPPENGYRFGVEGYLGAMNADYSLFIVENPNNPTGQIISLDGIRAIAAKALALDTILIVDEAYGDYMDTDNSALNLIGAFPNVAVTRSFSKGFGMAGIRLGYLAVSEKSGVLPQLGKVMCPFNCGGVARLLAEAMLDSRADVLKTAEIRANKRKVRGALTTLRAAETAETTPIMTLYYDTDDADFDLQRFLAQEARLAVVGCATYDGLDKRAARLMLPGTKAVEEKLLPMLAKAQALLP